MNPELEQNLATLVNSISEFFSSNQYNLQHLIQHVSCTPTDPAITQVHLELTNLVMAVKDGFKIMTKAIYDTDIDRRLDILRNAPSDDRRITILHELKDFLDKDGDPGDPVVSKLLERYQEVNKLTPGG